MGNWIHGLIECPYCGELNDFDLMTSNDSVRVKCKDCLQWMIVEERVVAVKDEE